MVTKRNLAVTHPRESKEFLRRDNEFSVVDACHFARDIMWASGNPLNEGDIAWRSWEYAGTHYSLWASDMDTDAPEYELVYQRTAEDLYDFTFGGPEGRFTIWQQGTESPERDGDDIDILILMDHLAKNDSRVEKPTINHDGAKMFEKMAAYYACMDAMKHKSLPNASILHLITDHNRRVSLRSYAIDEVLRRGIVVDDEIVPYTRSKGLAIWALEEMLNQVKAKKF